MHSGPTCTRVKGCEEPSSSKFLLWVTFFNVINDDVFSGDVATKKKRASNVNAICSWNISSTSAQYISGFLEIYQAFLVSISRFLEIYWAILLGFLEIYELSISGSGLVSAQRWCLSLTRDHSQQHHQMEGGWLWLITQPDDLSYCYLGFLYYFISQKTE